MIAPHNDRQPLGPVAADALEEILAATDPGEGIDRERAVRVLVDAGFTDQTVDRVVQRLIDRGYCYLVDGRLFVTERDDRE